MAKKRRLKKSVKRTLVALCLIVLTLCSLLLYNLFQQTTSPSTETVANVETLTTLCIDPGHGGYDAGTVALDGSMEKEINLAISLKVGEYINDLDPRIKVIYTRTSDEITWPESEEEDLQARIDYAKENKADYFLSIHMNSNEDSSIYGYEGYVRQDDTFSQSVYEKLASNLDAENWEFDRGIQYTENRPLYVVINAGMPCLLLEAGFMSNIAECQDLQQNNNQKIIARAVAQAYVDQIQEELNLEPYNE